LIVEFEIGSKAQYEKLYKRPEWPGTASGITVGIGYDLGYNSVDTILNDWANLLPPNQIKAMQRFSGITGSKAKDHLAAARATVGDISWEAAMAVFMKTSLPKFEAITLRACPGSDKLPAGCFGVLTSLSYNRGASYSKEGDRYREMRNIRSHIAHGDYDMVPHEIREMKRLWPNVAGLRRRRDREAALWEQSLKAAPVPLPQDDPRRADTGDEKEPLPSEVTTDDVVPVEEETKINVVTSPAKYSLEVQLIQKALISMKYFEVGEPDGKKGGKFVAGVAAFMTDRGKDPNKGQVTDALKNEINAAMSEKLPDGTPWSRPIAPARANATATEVAKTVPSVNANFWQKVMAFVVGIPTALTGLVQSFFGDKGSPSAYVQPVKDFFGLIPPELYWFVIAAIAVGIFLAAKKAQDATVKDYQQGKIN
jgi:hypothetical protein